MKQRRQYKLFPLPSDKENIKHVALKDINPIYQLYEDGTVFSRVKGCFLEMHLNYKKWCYVLNRLTGKTNSYTKERLLKEYFGIDETKAPQIGFGHKQMIGYGEKYQIYNNGKVWSFFKNDWLSSGSDKKGYLHYTLSNSKGEFVTELVHRLVAYNFKWNGSKKEFDKFEVHHVDSNNQNNSVENLEILSQDEHLKRHNKERSVNFAKAEET